MFVTTLSLVLDVGTGLSNGGGAIEGGKGRTDGIWDVRG